MDTLTELQTVLVHPNLRAGATAGLIYHRAEMSGYYARRPWNPEASPAPARDGEPPARAESLEAVRPSDKVIGTPDADLSRSELREKTGTVLAVKDVTIDIWPAGLRRRHGPVGSGKSTLVRTLIRLIEPTAGNIRICGEDVTGADAAAPASSGATASRWSSSTSACSPTAP